MKINVNVIIQVLAVILQYANFASDILPPKYQWIAAGIIGIVQAVTGILAHFKNPDGTPAAVAYKP